MFRTALLLALVATLTLASPIETHDTTKLHITTLPCGKQCTLYPNGNNQNDVPNILHAFSICGHNGIIIFPENEDFYIASKLNPVVHNVTIQWRGTWTISPDMHYWRQPQNHFPIRFQNHAASFVLTGNGIRIDGFGTGGIYGNGDVWYTADAGVTTPGRPMPFVFWNVSDVTVENFFVKQPPLWSLNIMNGTNMYFNNIECNATAAKAPFGQNWVQNTDGFDTMDVNNVHLTNFVYQGGDDCTAIKPRSYNVYVQNAVCHGGNGMAIGSLGQYLNDASVANVFMDNVTVIRRNEDLTNSAYIKTWIGVLLPQDSYESAGRPRGGGWGSVRSKYPCRGNTSSSQADIRHDILFSNFLVHGADSGPAISEDSGDNGSYPGTSKMQISNVAFVNFTGWLSGEELKNETAEISCSKVHPCYNIAYDNVSLTLAKNTTKTGTVACSYVSPRGLHGIVGKGCS